MEEAERLCDRILIIDHGRILADDTLAGLLAKVPVANRVLVDVAEDPPSAELIEALGQIAGVLTRAPKVPGSPSTSTTSRARR